MKNDVFRFITFIGEVKLLKSMPINSTIDRILDIHWRGTCAWGRGSTTKSQEELNNTERKLTKLKIDLFLKDRIQKQMIALIFIFELLLLKR